MAEREEWRDFHTLVVAVSDVQPFAVDDLQILTRPVVVCWVVLESLGKGGLECSQKSLEVNRNI